MLAVKTDDEGLVRTVEIGLRPQDKREPALPYKLKDLQKMGVGVKRLVLIQPSEEVGDLRGDQED